MIPPLRPLTEQAGGKMSFARAGLPVAAPRIVSSGVKCGKGLDIVVVVVVTGKRRTCQIKQALEIDEEERQWLVVAREAPRQTSAERRALT